VPAATTRACGSGGGSGAERSIAPISSRATHALDVEGDPRGGVQSEEYRTADPREVVVEDGTAMSAPGGAPQDGSTAEERRAEQRNDG